MQCKAWWTNYASQFCYQATNLIKSYVVGARVATQDLKVALISLCQPDIAEALAP